MNKPVIVTFQEKLDEFYFLGVEQVVSKSTNFGNVWDNYFKTVKGTGLETYESVIWYYKNNAQMYFVGKPADNAAKIPEGFALVKFPLCEYLVVTHTWLPEGADLYANGILPTQNYAGIGQTHDYKADLPIPDGYTRYDGSDSPITQIEIENHNEKGESRFERWIPIKKMQV